MMDRADGSALEDDAGRAAAAGACSVRTARGTIANAASASANTVEEDKAKPGRDVRCMTRVAPIRLGVLPVCNTPHLQDKVYYSDVFVIVVTTPSR